MDIVGRYEEKNRKKGMVMSTLIHIVLILLAILPFLTYPDPPPGQEGILVNLGLPDQGEGDNNAGPSEPTAPSEDVEEEVEEEPEVHPEPTPVKPEPKVDPEPVKQKDVIKTEDPEAIALKKEKEKKKKIEEERKKQEAEKKRQEEAKKKAAEEAKRKKAEEDARKKAEADALKNKIGGLFGDGDGKGKTGNPGNQGDPNGDPNSNILIGKSTGFGTAGGGLGNRGVEGRPKITDQTQKAGRIVIEVCVDSNGNVLSADYTQRGSTTTDSALRDVAIRNAKKWKFSKGDVDKQCGTITYDFKLQ